MYNQTKLCSQQTLKFCRPNKQRRLKRAGGRVGALILLARPQPKTSGPKQQSALFGCAKLKVVGLISDGASEAETSAALLLPLLLLLVMMMMVRLRAARFVTRNFTLAQQQSSGPRKLGSARLPARRGQP